MANRLRGRFGYPEETPFAVVRHGDKAALPHEWKKPRHIFVCSMGDLMHAEVPTMWIEEIMRVMNLTPRHTYQILTKRPERLLNFAWPSNCWVGVTVESQRYLPRIQTLRRVKAHIRFVSFEPLLTPIVNLNLEDIQWVIVGAETGPGKRPMDPKWASGIEGACQTFNGYDDPRIPFFFKRDSNGSRLLRGRKWEETP